jgi:hypothetical protein
VCLDQCILDARVVINAHHVFALSANEHWPPTHRQKLHGCLVLLVVLLMVGYSAWLAGFQQLFLTGFSPIKAVRITYPNSVDVSHDDHDPDQVSHTCMWWNGY